MRKVFWLVGGNRTEKGYEKDFLIETTKCKANLSLEEIPEEVHITDLRKEILNKYGIINEKNVADYLKSLQT